MFLQHKGSHTEDDVIVHSRQKTGKSKRDDHNELHIKMDIWMNISMSISLWLWCLEAFLEEQKRHH